ncbi:MAG: WD40 repeat domain-containing protein [Pseudonocardiaceae bacterium]
MLAVVFDPDGRILVTGGNDSTTRLWDVDSGKVRTPLDSGGCNAVALSTHNRILAIANDSSQVTLWKLATGSVLQRRTGHDDAVFGVAFDAEGGMLATSLRWCFTAGVGRRVVFWWGPRSLAG